MEKRSQRISEIDVMKGLGIILMILQHCLANDSDTGGVSNNISIAILSFHMPFFFFCSGLVSKSGDIKKILNKATTLVSPVILYGLFNILLWCILTACGFEEKYQYLCFAGFWFPLCIFYISILDVLVYKVYKKLQNTFKISISAILFQVIVASISFVLGSINALRVVGVENNIAITVVGYAFYLIGRILIVFINRLRAFSFGYKRIVFAGCGIVLFLVLFHTSRNNTPVYMYISDYGSTIWFLLNSLIGINALTLVSLSIKKNKVLEFLGQNSLIILFTHFPVHRIIILVLKYAVESHFILSLVACFITVVIEYGIINVINKKFEWLSGKIGIN